MPCGHAMPTLAGGRLQWLLFPLLCHIVCVPLRPSLQLLAYCSPSDLHPPSNRRSPLLLPAPTSLVMRKSVEVSLRPEPGQALL